MLIESTLYKGEGEREEERKREIILVAQDVI